ncbi:DUF1523 family protein [Tropicimonas sp. IMCC6043]|uniref:DUF1523 family protein n=1 Tax=Tropicimonas sp. IMCC6043 TaxID=2510645 RepID=UPI00101B9336|nr:DUF1523 family protein [Tropicimonas sp. IMCC6043]RYH09105.1 DUF1523 family protein [Tropicimonas sp. IMCC6043]
MWFYIRWTLWLLILAVIGAFLWYTLPRNDVVRITDTYEKRVDFGDNSLFWANSNTGESTEVTGRDIFFIQAFRPNGDVIVYRNEDTGWGWPPYFKFNTSNLQAHATDMKSTEDAPKWVAMKKYGWRIPFASIYPNAISVKPVDGPDVRIIPWVSITILVLLGCVWLAIWSRWRRFWDNRKDPILDGE